MKRRLAYEVGPRLAMLTLMFALGSGAKAEPRIEQIFGPETPTGAYKHPSSITELDDGALLLAYYGGGGEYETVTAVYGSRLERGSSSWTKPVVLASNPMYSMG